MDPIYKIKNYPKAEASFESGSIYTVFQPIVELSTLRIFGYEALTRGISRIRQPQELFRKAYEEGDAISFDLKCLATTLSNFPNLTKQQLLFINIEPVTLGNAFREGTRASNILQKVKPNGKQIVFEMTEGMKLRDFDIVKQGYKFLSKFGCKFAIDDVDGVDSKLLKLLTLKPDYIKVDMSLIQGIINKPIHQRLVQQLISLGEKNNCQIIAEGIENARDLAMVKRLGIPFVQGFWFGRPQRALRKKLLH